MKKESVKNWFRYARKNSLKFLSLLVVLSLCSAMRYAAIGKYSTFLQDSTQVVAGESFFSSNYLQKVDSVDEVKVSVSNARVHDNQTGFYISIGTWNKTEYTIPIEIRNYTNSLKYNKLDEQNTYFYVTADLFLDEECTNVANAESLTGHPNLVTLVSYDGAGSAYGEVGTITIDGVERKVALLKGGGSNGAFQKVNITVKTGGEDEKVEDSPIFIRVTANVIDRTSYSAISFKTDTDKTIDYTASTSAVFTQMLGGIFSLGSGSATANIEFEPDNHENSLQVIMAVACKAMEFQSEAKGRIYYQSSKLECGSETDKNVRLSEITDESEKELFKTERAQFATDNLGYIPAGTDMSVYDAYVEFDIQTASLKQFIFLKNSEADYDDSYFCSGVIIKKEAE